MDTITTITTEETITSEITMLMTMITILSETTGGDTKIAMTMMMKTPLRTSKPWLSLITEANSEYYEYSTCTIEAFILA